MRRSDNRGACAVHHTSSTTAINDQRSMSTIKVQGSMRGIQPAGARLASCMVHGAWLEGCMVHGAWCMVHGWRAFSYLENTLARYRLFSSRMDACSTQDGCLEHAWNVPGMCSGHRPHTRAQMTAALPAAPWALL